MNDETELHLGTVRAYRWWTLAVPPLDEWPADTVLARWEPGWLQAMNGTDWLPGVNTAGCTYGLHHLDDAATPADDCTCGFYAYWKPQHHDGLTLGRLPVFGAIDAGFDGDVIIFEHMLRAEKAAIAALHLPLTIGPKPPPPRIDPWADFPGKVYTYPGRDPDTGEYRDPRYPSVPELAPPSAEEIAEAELRGEAWCAVIGDRLRQLYPAAEVCETRDLLLARYPPDAEYGTMTPCQWCREPAATYKHEFSCHANPYRGSIA